jgi:hypothetical protein
MRGPLWGMQAPSRGPASMLPRMGSSGGIDDKDWRGWAEPCLAGALSHCESLATTAQWHLSDWNPQIMWICLLPGSKSRCTEATCSYYMITMNYLPSPGEKETKSCGSCQQRKSSYFPSSLKRNCLLMVRVSLWQTWQLKLCKS